MIENNNSNEQNLVLAAMFPTKKMRKEQEQKAAANAKKQTFMNAAADNAKKNIADITIGEVLDFFGVKDSASKMEKIFSIFETRQEKEISVEKIAAFIDSAKKSFEDFNALLDGLFKQFDEGNIDGIHLVNGFKNIVKNFANECEEISKIL